MTAQLIERGAESGATKATVSLRDYQAEAVAAAMDAYARGNRRALVALPTGTGKTVVGVHVAAELGGRCLWLVHRDELIDQAVEKFAWALPNASIGVVKAERDSVHADIVVGSIQTLQNDARLIRLLSFVRDCGQNFRLVVCDEAHHAVAHSWLNVLYGVGALPSSVVPDTELEAEFTASERRVRELLPADAPHVLGLTATPERMDGIGLDNVFEGIVYQRTMLQMILAGHLADIRARTVGRVDLTGVKSVGGDYADGSLARALIVQGVPGELARAYLLHAPERTALAFVPTVAMAHATAEAFRAVGVNAEAISGTTPALERADLIARLRGKKLRVLVNVGVLTEGFDAPAVDCIIIGRPTKSRPLYTQIIGRGTRTYPGKDDCLVLELMANNTAHKIVTVDTITGRRVGDGKSIREAVEEEERQRQERDLTRTAHTADVNLFASLRWRQVRGDRWYLGIPRGGVWLVPTDGDTCHIVVKEGARARMFVKDAIRIDYAQGLVEDWVRSNRWDALVRPGGAWRSQPASDAQRLWLTQRGLIREGEELTKGQAADLRNDYEGARGWR